MTQYEFMARARRVARLLSACALMLSIGVFAQKSALASGSQTPDTVAQRYPAGSIASVEAADKALADVERERKLVDARYMQEQADCYPKFFTTACLDDAKERHRAASAQLRAVEVEANAFKRKAKVIERDRSIEERRAQDEIDAKQRALSVRPSQPENTEKPGEQNDALKANNRNKSAMPLPDKTERHHASVEQEQRQQAEDAQKREENIRKYEKKVQEAQERQREVAAKKAEKERERAEKANSVAKP